eukprot:766712-Hanusia_phi.AAC.3
MSRLPPLASPAPLADTRRNPSSNYLGIEARTARSLRSLLHRPDTLPPPQQVVCRRRPGEAASIDVGRDGRAQGTFAWRLWRRASFA